MTHLRMRVVATAVALLSSGGQAHAKDFGTVGQIFGVVEVDLLSVIEARLKQAQASGEIDRVNAGFAKRAVEKAKRPTPVTGITPTAKPRSWTFDPTMTVQRDIRDQKGNLIAAAGHKVNPLDFVSMHQALIFVDGDDGAQLDWAVKAYPDLKAKIIFVKGSPFEAMGQRKRRFYFDQEGRLTSRFGIAHVPAVVSQTGKVLDVSELVPPHGKAS